MFGFDQFGKLGHLYVMAVSCRVDIVAEIEDNVPVFFFTDPIAISNVSYHFMYKFTAF